MSASSLPSARPAWAVVAWVDDNFVYTEVHSLSGPPLIQKFEYCEGGLSKALGFMRDLHRKHNPTGGIYTITQQANITKKTSSTEEQRQRARNVLRKLGIV